MSEPQGETAADAAAVPGGAAPAGSPESDVPPHRYTAALADKIELSWQDRWEAEGTFNTPNPTGDLAEGFAEVADRPRLFVNDMFPYPSSDGLHVGHPLGYIGTDVYARYKRMAGFNVLHTMGFDAFGLPAEQYAVETGQHPRTTTERNIATFTRQLRRLGLGHDRRRAVATTDIDYYRWTQWIFLQIYNAWYDPHVGSARHVDTLIAELDKGTRQPLRGTNPYGQPWAELTEPERRQVVDNHRLAYVSEAPVNWCPGLGTVLANEEVTPDGRSERGNFPVFQRPLRQWMLRITAYADRLLSDLDKLDWPEKVRTMQRNWIGRSTGASIFFPTAAGRLEVFTTRPDTLYGATYMVLAPEHPLVGPLTAPAWPEGTRPVWTNGASSPVEAVAAYEVRASQRTELERQAEGREKTGVFTGSFATHPVTGAQIPIFVADYVLMGYGTGAIMAVPGQDERDWEFAETFELPIVRTVQPSEDFDGKAYLGEGPAINSSVPGGPDLNGLGVEDAKAAMTTWLTEHGVGFATVTYKLRDWLFSRQRYWGEPFPIVYDERGLPRALPESMLPVELPATDDFAPRRLDPNDTSSEPEPPLGRVEDWAHVAVDLGDGEKTYRRELNTMPQWAGSCWYEIRYTDPRNAERFVDPAIERYWLGPREHGDTGGVDLYVGGIEHAVLHLLYARFWHKVLFDLGYLSSSEPFRRLLNQGYIQAYAFTDDRGFYVEAAKVVERDGKYYYGDTEVKREFGKMGKSLKNSVSPDEMYAEYGADTLRLYEMFTGPMEQSRPWDTKAVVGAQRLLQRVWRNCVDEQTGESRVRELDEIPEESLRVLHRSIDGVRAGMESMRFNIAVAKITELNNHVTQVYGEQGAPRALAEPLVLMLAPLAPHVAEELWSRMDHEASLVRAPFPEADSTYLVDEMIEIPVQVNGKVRTTVQIPSDADAGTMESAARADERIAEYLAGGEVRKVVTVPGRLVNFVVG